MRPLRLDMAGFTVFRDATTVDFTDADFFALVGPTGSGKSTVLDAICFALYGTAPRWGGTRGIANALAPSATEARVRLVFESAGARYVATRVVRRDGRGNVKTGNAGLELLPAGFDVTKLETGMSPEDLGEPLAGTPRDMDAAVTEAIGLPYEQFITCVVLPQGQFADFLHAKPATRQQILVNLLGLGVYEEIQKRASARAVRAEAQFAAVDQVLRGLADADDAAVTDLAERVAAMRALAESVEAAVPELHRARAAATTAAERLTALDAEITELDRVRPPADVAAVARVVSAARTEAADAVAAVTLAEEREEKLRGELAAAGDATALRLMLQAHLDRDRLTGEVTTGTAGLTAAEAAHRDATTVLGAARAAADRATAGLEAARRAYQDAQTADRAAALRAQLTTGGACPVCAQPVTEVPAIPVGSAVTAAEAAGHAAKAAAKAADAVVAERDRTARDRERELDRARARHEQLTTRLDELAAKLADSPGPTVLHRELSSVEVLRAALEEAGGAVRAAREAQRRTRHAVELAEERMRAAWRGFDTVRDTVARLGPPAVERDDPATAWSVLGRWAAGETELRQGARATALGAVADAQAAVRAVEEQISGVCAAAGLTIDDDHVRGVAVAVERAEADHRRLTERCEQRRQLEDQRGEHERAGQIAKALAGHLRANNFERWLLTEALDLLVDGASRILRELSTEQYELIHDKGEFFVVDHHDAGLRRGVRTLSGGETFQASLALALALSEQLAGLSSTGASLESIVLDEGFGTLDAATLDTVTATLENLAARGDRMVGVVTHVPALAERVPVRFEVSKDARTARVERTGL